MRLDESEPETRAAIQHGGRRPYDESAPVDSCPDCVTEYGLEEFADVEHPSYSDDAYTCIFCDRPLNDAD